MALHLLVREFRNEDEFLCDHPRIDLVLEGFISIWIDNLCLELHLG